MGGIGIFSGQSGLFVLSFYEGDTTASTSTKVISVSDSQHNTSQGMNRKGTVWTFHN